MKDPDIERWTAAWREGTPIATDLARGARRERRWLLAWIALDCTFGLALIVFGGWLWFIVDSPSLRFVAAGIVALTVTALAFLMWNWRGTLADELSSATEFLALARRRSRARLRYVRFGWWILVADLVIIVGYHGLQLREGLQPTGRAIATAAAVIAAGAAIILLWGRYERRRADRLEALQKAMDENAENGHE